MNRDHYRTLGVPRDAGEKEIRSAHRALARKYHPDAGTGASEEQFREIQHAYDVLIDPERRRAYDRTLASAVRITVSDPPPHRTPHGTAFPDHLDLRHLGARRTQAEPLQFRTPASRRHSLEEEMLRDMLEFMRFLDRF